MGDSTKTTIGVFVVPDLEFKATCRNPEVVNVRQTARHVSQNVVHKVRDAYNVDLAPGEMETNYYPEG